MLCEKPYIKDGVAFACGQCLPCRHKRAKVWAHRIELEATQHAENSFITLTYTDQWVIKNEGNLRTRDLTLFFKRLRKGGWKFRYYAVGEYGDKTRRPHYHLALFGEGPCVRGQTDLRRSSCCSRCDFIARTWGMGAIQSARLEPGSAAYIAGYVTKKLRKEPLPQNLSPEFQRMSNRPGIGYGVVHDVAHVLLKHYPDIEDVPVVLQHGQSVAPLGKYLRKKIRLAIGRDEKAPQSVIEKMAQEMQPLRESAFLASKSFSSALLEKNKGARTSFLTRRKIFQSKEKL